MRAETASFIVFGLVLIAGSLALAIHTDANDLLALVAFALGAACFYKGYGEGRK
jgi:hypothetical protein